ncbi:Site-specific DNA methylase [Pseudomonas sp. LAMO17WK12:I10]|nr:D12 class N6 adenine-specific DNA methyltransferase [Pseudomonas sp. LAMO17WK12:I9]SNY23345.1 Site-specific DNA methylase [Pseudomonas sp. LAMO17WK12:I10]
MSTPIIPWMGGKRRLADRLIPLFPPHECYVEVFAGGAALYFMRPQPAPVEVLNDINGDLVTLYRVVQNHLEEFVRQFICFIGKLGGWSLGILPKSGSLFQGVPNYHFTEPKELIPAG